MDKQNKFFTNFCGIAFLLLFAFLFIFSVRPMETGDIWWHLKIGQWIVDNGTVPFTDPFASINKENPWFLTQWAGSCLLYGIFAGGGFWGLKIFRVIVFMISLLLFYYYTRKKVSKSMCLSLILLLAFAFSVNLRLRPLLFNAIFIQLMLIVLWNFYKTGKLRWLLTVPGIGAVWGNIHLGSFFYGFSLIAVFFLASAVDYFNSYRLKANSQEEFELQKKKALRYMLAGILYLASLMISPYGIYGVIHPLKTILIPSHINFFNFNFTVTEMRAPVETLLSLKGFWFYLLLITAFYFVARSSKAKLLKMLLLMLGLGFFLYAGRGRVFFAICAGYVIVWGVEDLGWREKVKQVRILRRGEYAFFLTIIIVLIGLISHYFNRKVYQDNKFERYIFLNVDPYNAVRGIKFLKDNFSQGLIFNADSLGGQILWLGDSAFEPFVDGRQIDKKRFEVWNFVLAAPDLFLSKAHDDYGFFAIMLDSGLGIYARLFNYLAQSQEWHFVFYDNYTAVFVSKEACALAEAQCDLSLKLGKEDLTFDPAEISLGLAKEKHSIPDKIKGLLNPPVEYIDLTQEGALLYNLGYSKAGLNSLVAGYTKTRSLRSRKILMAAYRNYQEKKGRQKIQ